MQIISVNIAPAKPLLASGRKVLSAIGKRAAERAVPVMPIGLLGMSRRICRCLGDWRRRCMRIRWSTMRFGKRQAASGKRQAARQEAR
jgi:hypothetical protein